MTAAKVLASYVYVESVEPQPIRRNLYGRTWYVTDGIVRIRYGKHSLEIPSGYEFDGPSIPRLFWSIVGLSPLDDEALFASLGHDWVCDHPDEMPRVMGDALFVSAMGPHVWNGRTFPGVPNCRRRLMYFAVRFWSTWFAKESPKQNASDPTNS